MLYNFAQYENNENVKHYVIDPFPHCITENVRRLSYTISPVKVRTHPQVSQKLSKSKVSFSIHVLREFELISAILPL